VGAVVELEGEGITDELLADLCMHVTAAAPSPIAIDESGVPADVVDKEREIAKTQAIEQGKPENIATKIVEGKIRKFFEEYVLLKQPFVKDDKLSVCDILPAGVTIKSFTRMQVGGAG
ncbi:MAG: elongation factor Ts, partial [Phycisphaerae bacterium]|nr:elongation factor Ts [Phycisphaerae bacterium]